MLAQSGRKGRVVSIDRLEDLKTGILGPNERGLLDPVFYQEWLSNFDFHPDKGKFHPSSIIVVATPAPQHQVTFQLDDRDLPLLIPPTYLFGQQVDAQTAAVLDSFLAPRGYHLALTNLPKKLTAVRSGLACYGRNNITYVEGMGSFHRLAIFYSDMPCEQDSWREPVMLERCEKCSACRKRCPTGAISADRFLLHAERCITYHNEQSIDVPFPDDLEDGWHNALVGCMLCQHACPVDKPYLKFIEFGPRFDTYETRLFCQGVALEHLPPATRQKLVDYDLDGMLSAWPRNLGVFARRASSV